MKDLPWLLKKKEGINTQNCALVVFLSMVVTKLIDITPIQRLVLGVGIKVDSTERNRWQIGDVNSSMPTSHDTNLTPAIHFGRFGLRPPEIAQRAS